MLIDPVWCVESNAWLRINIDENGQLIAQMAHIDEHNPFLTKPWKTVSSGTWHVIDPEVPSEYQHSHFRLFNNELYRYSGINTISKAPNFSKYSIARQGWARERTNPFDTQYSFPIKTIATNFQLPLLPEEQQKRWQTLQQHLDYERFITSMDSSFTIEQRQELASFLPTVVEPLSATHYSSYQEHLVALHNAINNENDPYHIALITQAARTVDYTTLKDSTINIAQLFVMKKNFFFQILTMMYNHIHSQFVSPAVALVKQNAGATAMDLNDPSNETESTSPVEMIKAVNIATQKYNEWYKGKHSHRGANGFFSWARHGAYGQQRAETLKNELSTVQDRQGAVVQINAFLTDSQTRYHRHSLASFLLDELQQIQSSPWSQLTCDASSKLYDQGNVFTHLNNPPGATTHP